jgi:FRG domain
VPPDELLSLLALAQHNGVPTRLLDWSRDPKIAAYFAAVNAAEQVHHNDKQVADYDICVWAMSLTIFHGPPRSDIPGAEGFYLITAPAAGNANLRAQRGVFVLHRPKGEIDFDPPFTCAPIEQKSELRGKTSELFQFTLPVREAPRLLRLLSKREFAVRDCFPHMMELPKQPVRKRGGTARTLFGNKATLHDVGKARRVHREGDNC